MTLHLAPRRLRARRQVGIAVARGRLLNVADLARGVDVDLTVDSGAIYSVVPGGLLRQIGVRPQERETFWMADGRSVRRSVGWALFELQGRRAPSRVIFGRSGDACLLGAVTLEELGLSSTRSSAPCGRSGR